MTKSERQARIKALRTAEEFEHQKNKRLKGQSNEQEYIAVGFMSALLDLTLKINKVKGEL
jgi:hypothetical protein